MFWSINIEKKGRELQISALEKIRIQAQVFKKSELGYDSNKRIQIRY